MKELVEIQSRLKAPKGQYNTFGGYNYRSAEDILEALKPILAEQECVVMLTDEILLIGDRYYIKSTATLTNKDGQECSAIGLARESLTKKGMDEAQITGSASSYARKYALNGLFAIDDGVDDDKTNQGQSAPQAQPATQVKQKQTLSEERFQNALKALKAKQIDKSALDAFELTDKQKQELAKIK